MANSDRVSESPFEGRPAPPSPPPSPSDQWILQSLNNLNGRVGEVEKDVKALLKETATLTESTKDIPQIKKELKKMHIRVAIALGIFLTLTYLAGYLFSSLSITIAPIK